MARVKGLKHFNYGSTRNAIQQIVFVGAAGAGAIAITGLQVGDQVWSASNVTTPAAVGGSFESTVTVTNQLQQTGVGLGAQTIVALIKKV